MKVKTLVVVFSALCFVASVSMAQHGVALLGAYTDAADGNAGYGLMLRYQFDMDPQANSLRFLTQLGYLTGFGEDASEAVDGDTLSMNIDAEVIPLEVGLVYDFSKGDRVVIYAGGGVGYYFTDTEMSLSVAGVMDGMQISVDMPSSWYSYSTDDALGGFGMVGLELSVREQIKAIAELRYTYLVLDDEFVVQVPGDPVEQWSDEVDLSGLGVSVGVLWEF